MNSEQRVMSILLREGEKKTVNEVFASWNKILASEGMEVDQKTQILRRSSSNINPTTKRIDFLIWIKPIQPLTKEDVARKLLLKFLSNEK